MMKVFPKSRGFYYYFAKNQRAGLVISKNGHFFVISWQLWQEPSNPG
jgi:hypothetical protein